MTLAYKCTSVIGLLNYGLSLIFFVLALRYIGASRTGANFSLAPFVGAVLSVIALGESITHQLVAAAGLMALGVWLCLPKPIRPTTRNRSN